VVRFVVHPQEERTIVSVIGYLVSIFVPWITKTVLYHFAFRWRHIHATIQTKLIVAGAPMLVRFFFPFPLPSLILFLAAVGVGIYLCKQYTDGKLFPDIVGIVGGIEMIASIVIDGLILPMLV
jgi:hypothetical protein